MHEDDRVVYNRGLQKSEMGGYLKSHKQVDLEDHVSLMQKINIQECGRSRPWHNVSDSSFFVLERVIQKEK